MADFEWIVHYKDGIKYQQKSSLSTKEFKYTDIDRSQIVAFEIVEPIYKNDNDFIIKIGNPDEILINTKWITKTYKRIFLMEIDKNKIFFFRRLPRMSLITGERLEHLTRYLVGWKIIFDILGDRGQIKQRVEIGDHNIIYSDGHVETHAPRAETNPILFDYEIACRQQ